MRRKKVSRIRTNSLPSINYPLATRGLKTVYLSDYLKINIPSEQSTAPLKPLSQVHLFGPVQFP